MKRWPLRWQITLWSVLITALALVTFGAVVLVTLYAQQIEAVDGQLATDARFAFSLPGEAGPLRQADLERLAALSGSDRKLYGFVLGPARPGAALAARPAALAAALPPWPPTRQHFTRKVGGRRLRFGVFIRQDTALVLAASLRGAEESVGDLLGAYAIALPAVLLIVGAGSWWIARRALRPVTAITAATAQITADRLGERLPVPPTEDEIGRHIRVLNGMFDRLERSFEQASRFTADAAHELRTPLTIMRGQLEEALRSGCFNAEQQALLVGLLEENTGLQRIAENLLLLARFDTGRSQLLRAPVDLSASVDEAREDAELLAASRRIRIGGATAPDVSVEGDGTMLRRVLLNLIDNAVKFNGAEGEVRIDLRREDGDALVIVGNSGPGIPEERRAHLFQRFYRADTSRNSAEGGSGLGLSLCREIITAHGGRIDLTRADGDWTEFTVRLPRRT